MTTNLTFHTSSSAVVGVDQRRGKATIGRQILHVRMYHWRISALRQRSLVSSLHPAAIQGAGNLQTFPYTSPINKTCLIHTQQCTTVLWTKTRNAP
jgi:hypothetical protein